MVLKLFGLKRKGDKAPASAPAAAPPAPSPPESADPDDVVEFVEVAPPTAAAPAKPAKKALTPKQRAQRKYAAGMKQVRKRASKAKGGKGRIAKRGGATKLRRELGLKPGKATGKKAGRKKR